MGGKTNLCHNAVDRHLKDRADQNALIFVSTETDQEKVYSFRELHTEVQRMAAILKDLGVQKGDRVLIYMPMIAEACFAMLACAKIGAKVVVCDVDESAAATLLAENPAIEFVRLDVSDRTAVFAAFAAGTETT